MAKKNSAPVKVYGIDDFITEMKTPMPFINTISRIHLLTGFNKGALIMLRNYLHWIIEWDKYWVYRRDWITKDGIKLIGEPVNDAKDPKKNGRAKRITPLHMHQLFLIVAIDYLIDGKDIPVEMFTEKPMINGLTIKDPLIDIPELIPPQFGDSELMPFYTESARLRAIALVRFYTRERVLKTEGALYKQYNNVSKPNYRHGRAIAKNDRSRYIEDHEMCGKILDSMNDQKAFSQWQDDRNLLKKNPDFMDHYISE